MTVLAQLADAEILVRLDGDELVVRPKRPLNEKQLGWLRNHKQELIREIMTCNFIDLVRVTGAGEFGFLFHNSEIEAEIDDEGREQLPDTTRQMRQSWALSIAQRLYEARVSQRRREVLK